MIKLEDVKKSLEIVRDQIETSIMKSQRQLRIDIDSDLDGIRDKTMEIQQKVGEVAWDVSAMRSMMIAQRDKDLAHDEKLAAVIIIPYRGTPTVIKNGDPIDCKNCTSISFNWDSGELPTVEVVK